MLEASLDKEDLLSQHHFTKDLVYIHFQSNFTSLQQPPREAESDDILVRSTKVDGVDGGVDVFEALEALLVVSVVIIFGAENLLVTAPMA